MNSLTHIDESGKARMVDVGNKKPQQREATATGKILLSENTLNLIRQNEMKKGDVLTTAEIAGIQAAKRTASLIPLCHQLMITKISVQTSIENNGIMAKCYAKCIGQTGIEMEALTGVSVALLTIYDMCKAVDKNMIIENIQLINKTKTDIE